MPVKAALMCHAPIVIPAIAGARVADCRRSTSAMEKAAHFLVDDAPDVLVILSPHTPRLATAFGVLAGESYNGSFDQFGHPELSYSIPVCDAAVSDLVVRANKTVDTELISAMQLDHGVLVPLHFLCEAGWGGSTIVVAFPGHTTHTGCRSFGDAIRETATQRGERWAICASGDMSHRLSLNAPAGFDPQAKEFDRYVSEGVRCGDYLKAVNVDPCLRELAAEDVIDSLEVAASAASFTNQGGQFYDYEGPFGVGYLNVALYDWKIS